MRAFIDRATYIYPKPYPRPVVCEWLALQNANFGKFEGGSDLPYAHLSHLVSNFDAFVQVFTQGMSRQETASKSVSRSVGVDNLVVGKLGYGVGFRVGLVRVDIALGEGSRRGGHKRRVGSLGNDNETRSRRVGFRQVGDRASNLRDARVLLDGETVRRTDVDMELFES